MSDESRKKPETIKVKMDSYTEPIFNSLIDVLNDLNSKHSGIDEPTQQTLAALLERLTELLESAKSLDKLIEAKDTKLTNAINALLAANNQTLSASNSRNDDLAEKIRSIVADLADPVIKKTIESHDVLSTLVNDQISLLTETIIGNNTDVVSQVESLAGRVETKDEKLTDDLKLLVELLEALDTKINTTGENLRTELTEKLKSLLYESSESMISNTNQGHDILATLVNDQISLLTETIIGNNTDVVSQVESLAGRVETKDEKLTDDLKLLVELLEALDTKINTTGENLRTELTEKLKSLLYESSESMISNTNQGHDILATLVNDQISLLTETIIGNNTNVVSQVESLAGRVETKDEKLTDDLKLLVELLEALDTKINTTGENLRTELTEKIKSLLYESSESMISNTNQGHDVLATLVNDQVSLLQDNVTNCNTNLVTRVNKFGALVLTQLRKTAFLQRLIGHSLNDLAQSSALSADDNRNQFMDLKSITAAVADDCNGISETLNATLENTNSLISYTIEQDYPNLKNKLSSIIVEIESLLKCEVGCLTEQLYKLQNQISDRQNSLKNDFITALHDLSDSYKTGLSSTIKLLTNLETTQKTVTDEVISIISNAIVKADTKINAVEEQIANQTETINSKIAELMQEQLLLQEDVREIHQTQTENKENILKQIGTNQELLIWILTPWYKKIFRRKNGKPQILTQQSSTKPIA